MPTETIKIGSQEHQIKVKPITIICPGADMATQVIEYPNRLVLTPEDTTHHASLVIKLHTRFAEVWRFFMANCSRPVEIDYEITSDRIRQMGTGCLHLMGLIDLSLKFIDMKVPIVWRNPESYLHPGWQVALADLAIHLYKPA